jgi:hypothetical protein
VILGLILVVIVVVVARHHRRDKEEFEGPSETAEAAETAAPEGDAAG